MMNKEYNKEFSNYINIMSEALKREDFKAYEYTKSMLDECIEECKENKALMNEMKTSNFGVLNHIFESQLPTLLKANKKAVRDVVKAIREDVNLRSEFNFYNVIKNQYNSDLSSKIGAEAMLNEIADVIINNINQDTVIDSNKKLRKIMEDNNVVPIDYVDDDSRKLYESGHILLTNKKKASNMIALMESQKSVCEYMENHKVINDAKKKDVGSLIEEFENKLKTNLNESEMSFVKQITDFKSPIAEQRKEKLFNKFKNECVEKLNKMLKEDKGNESLKSLSKQIGEMKYNNESIVGDIAKLLEIRDILSND